jgi:DNA polymerase kappa
MPGFHEHDEDDLGPHLDEENEDNTDAGLVREFIGSSLLDHVSEGGMNVEAGPSTIQIRSKPLSSTTAAKHQGKQGGPTVPESSSQTCPICSKTLETDNHGLNAHIDYCLSRDAIRDAHAEFASPLKPDSHVGSHSHNMRSRWEGFGKTRG